ncbi:uncharacterized protein DS421_1g12810 [Arachis hypogaea]|nr:uncharacterized protein DS421_1g12810 [Arachis hypogaea]
MPSLSHTMGVPLKPLGVACQFINPERDSTWACHLVSKVWHANSSSSLGRATWYRRHGTPALAHHLDVPLEDPGVACQAWRSQLNLGVPLGVEGVARQISSSLGRAT